MLAKIQYFLISFVFILVSGVGVHTQLQPNHKPGEVNENPKDGLKYEWIPPGTFLMGCSPGDNQCYDDEKPSHQVTLSKGFWIGQTVVTVGAYKRFGAATGASVPEGQMSDQHPVLKASWENATEYCRWAGGRLPTEAEWEYSARGGSTESRYGPINEIAWYRGNAGQLQEVGQLRANAFGLFDMLGNVWQWVNDWYDANYYQSSPANDPPGPSSGQYRLMRGGSKNEVQTGVRVSSRFPFKPVYLNVSPGVPFGFRCVVEAVAP